MPYKLLKPLEIATTCVYYRCPVQGIASFFANEALSNPSGLMGPTP
jgi:hypothetical protein